MDQLRQKKGFICDMDGVIYHGNRLLPGVKEFVDWLYREEKNFRRGGADYGPPRRGHHHERRGPGLCHHRRGQQL